jgi:urease accessory protein
MTERSPEALLRLLAWTSPAFPVGSYAYSHGIEYAIEAGLIGGADDLGRWVGEIVARGAGFADAVFLAHTWRATRSGDEAALAAVGERASAYRGSAEAALESEAQGRAFVAAVGAGWPQLRPAEGTRPIPPYAVAVGASAARGGIDIEDAVAAFLHAFAANLVSAGVRLIPLGQGEGVRVLAALAPTIGVVAAKALVTGLDDLGTATVRVDWTMARHETQHVRLFRS